MNTRIFNNSTSRQIHGEQPLPDELAQLIKQVMRRTWLWPWERRDVRAELENHFFDGLRELQDEGLNLHMSTNNLIESFGDPKLAARLIRRSKKRGRPLIVRIMTALVVVLIPSAAALGGVAAWMNFGEPNPSVDYLAQLNEPIDHIPMKDRSWPILKDVILGFTSMPDSLSRYSSPVPWPEEDRWPMALAWVNENQHLLDDLHLAAKKPHMGFLYGNEHNQEFIDELNRLRNEDIRDNWFDNNDSLSPVLMGIMLPHLTEFRQVVRLLTYNGRIHQVNGNLNETWRSLDAAHRLGGQMFEGTTLIEQLVGISTLQHVYLNTIEALDRARAQMTDHDFQILKNTALYDDLNFRINLHGERLMFEDVVQYLFTDDGNGDGVLIPRQFELAITWSGASVVEKPNSDHWADDLIYQTRLLKTVAAHAGRKETMEKFDELWDKSNNMMRTIPLDNPQQRRSIDSIYGDLAKDSEQGQRFALLWMFMPSLTRADLLMQRAGMRQYAVQAVAAIFEYEHHSGRLPDSLYDLVPEYLNELPVDVFSGEALVYRQRDDDFRLYSVGENCQDDGGEPPRIDRSNGNRYRSMDDVYWPLSD